MQQARLPRTLRSSQRTTKPRMKLQRGRRNCVGRVAGTTQSWFWVCKHQTLLLAATQLGGFGSLAALQGCAVLGRVLSYKLFLSLKPFSWEPMLNIMAVVTWRIFESQQKHLLTLTHRRVWFGRSEGWWCAARVKKQCFTKNPKARQRSVLDPENKIPSFLTGVYGLPLIEPNKQRFVFYKHFFFFF